MDNIISTPIGATPDLKTSVTPPIPMNNLNEYYKTIAEDSDRLRELDEYLKAMELNSEAYVNSYRSEKIKDKKIGNLVSYEYAPGGIELIE